MYIYIYLDIYICMYIYVYRYIYIDIQIYRYVYIQIHILNNNSAGAYQHDSRYKKVTMFTEKEVDSLYKSRNGFSLHLPIAFICRNDNVETLLSFFLNIYIYTYIYIYIYINIHIYIYIYIYIYICIYLKNIYTYVHVCERVFVCDKKMDRARSRSRDT